MISIEDVIGLCGLDEAEVDAISEHEHIPEIAAAAMGAYLLEHEHGPEKIVGYIRDDMRAALGRGDKAHARELFMALRHFLSEHPEGRVRRPGPGAA